VVSLHTIHHLPDDEHIQAYREIYRMLAPGSSAVIVDGWRNPPLMRMLTPFIRFRFWLARLLVATNHNKLEVERTGKSDLKKNAKPRGTFVRKYDAAWLKLEVGQWMPLRIYCWRSVSVQFMRAMVHPRFGGRQFLRLLYGLEERFPRFFGELGQYPLVVVNKKDLV
jgi:SAM-dependent methyltransferase